MNNCMFSFETQIFLHLIKYNLTKIKFIKKCFCYENNLSDIIVLIFYLPISYLTVSFKNII